jgi:hypothetical protein
LIATTVFSTILNNVVAEETVARVTSAVEAGGGSSTVAQDVLAALPVGSSALRSVHGITDAILAAVGNAQIESYIKGTETVAYSAIAFGMVGVIACFFLEDIGPKMTSKIEVFLENDVHAKKNKYH